MAYSQAIVLYEGYLLGKNPLTMPGTSKQEKFNNAKEVIRYAFSELLGWSPEDSVYHVSKNLLDRLHLTEYIENYFIYPDDLVRNMDYDYILAICFSLPVDYRFQLLKHKRLVKLGIEPKFKKELFNGNLGRARAAYLLMDVISTSVALPQDGMETETEKLYARFADTAGITKILRREGLYHVCTRLYNSPLEFLHYSLPPEKQDDLLFAVYEFNSLFQQLKT